MNEEEGYKQNWCFLVLTLFSLGAAENVSPEKILSHYEAQSKQYTVKKSDSIQTEKQTSKKYKIASPST